MKLKQLSIGAFGKLKNRTFTFSDGLNLIYGKNEDGKSTLCAFIDYMLYGFSAQKARSVEENDKLKYLPWDAEAMQGSALFSCGDETYRVERRTASKSTVRITDSTGSVCNFGREPGEEWLGIDETAFLKMAFIRQNDVSADRMKNLSDIVQNTIYAADETVDIEKARKKLTDYRSAYRGKTRRTGKCVELEESIEKLSEDFREASARHQAMLGAEARLAELTAKIERNRNTAQKCTLELQNIDAYDAATQLSRLKEAQAHADEARRNTETLEKALTFGGTVCDEKTADGIFSLQEKLCRCVADAEEAKRTHSETASQLQSACEKSGIPRLCGGKTADLAAVEETASALAIQKKRAHRSAFAAGAAIVLAAAAGALAAACSGGKLHPPFPASYPAAAAALLFLLFLFCFFLSVSAHRRQKKLLSAWENTDAETFLTLAEKIPQLRDRLSHLKEKETLLAEDLDKKDRACHDASAELSAALEPFGISADGAAAFAAALREKLSALRQAESARREAEAAYRTLQESCNEKELVERAEKRGDPPTRDKKTVQRELDYVTGANENLAVKEKELEKQVYANPTAVRKPSEILAEKQALEKQLAEADEKTEAADLALEALEGACADLKGAIAPHIAARTQKLFGIFTGGARPPLEIAPDFGIGVTEGGILREAGYLSKGTSDAAYLALRIALCETLFSEKPILVFDETFAYIDDDRLDAMLTFLKELARDYQIFVFTCHDREMRILSQTENADGVQVL